MARPPPRNPGACRCCRPTSHKQSIDRAGNRCDQSMTELMQPPVANKMLDFIGFCPMARAAERKRRYQTVELIVEKSLWKPKDTGKPEVVQLRVGYLKCSDSRSSDKLR
jgi:hypothetical protein